MLHIQKFKQNCNKFLIESFYIFYIKIQEFTCKDTWHKMKHWMILGKIETHLKYRNTWHKISIILKGYLAQNWRSIRIKVGSLIQFSLNSILV